MHVTHCRGGHFISGKSVPGGAERSGWDTLTRVKVSPRRICSWLQIVIIQHLWKIGTNSSRVWDTGTKSSRVWDTGTNTSHVWGIGTNSSRVRIINMWNLSTDFTPQNLSKLTIRKSHILQMWCIGTNSSHGCEIYEVWNLRFNRAFPNLPTKVYFVRTPRPTLKNFRRYTNLITVWSRLLNFRQCLSHYANMSVQYTANFNGC